MADDARIIPYIHAANIACGYHAGDVETMQAICHDCRENQVAVGAHPSFPDREHFGRKEMNLPAGELYEIIIQQLLLMQEVAANTGMNLYHVKPHGALYNLSARDIGTARVIARAVSDFNPALVLFGLSGSHSLSEAKELGLQTASEVFADRRYLDDGSLCPRDRAEALIQNPADAVEQVLQMVREGTVTTISGKTIPILAETICIHGDGEHALEFARSIHQTLAS